MINEERIEKLFEEITDVQMPDETKLVIYRNLRSEAYEKQDERKIEIYEELVRRTEEKLEAKKI